MERRKIEDSLFKRLPDDIKKLTDNYVGRERDIVLLSSLGVLSDCLPNVYGVYDEDIVYPHLYILIIAPAASGKGIMMNSRILIEKIHDKVYSDSLKLRKNYFRNNDKSSYSFAPPLSVKILPANISSAQFYTFLESSKYGLIIIESEADTLSKMLKNDWSNFSDILRVAFQHEPLSASRKKDELFVQIKEPKLAMVISGTPEQVKPLINSRENGLFSRFIIYSFNEISTFKDVFAKNNKNSKVAFKEVGDEIYKLYGNLVNHKSIEFSFTESQQKKFINRMKPISADIIENFTDEFIPNVNRHGLIMFKIAMILTLIRNKDNISETTKKLFCSNEDFMSALYLTKTLLRHSQYLFDTFDNSSSLSNQDIRLLNQLNEKFTTQEAYTIGNIENISERTMFDKLQQWLKKHAIKKESRGNYKKQNM